MDSDLRDLAAFGDAYERPIRLAWERARQELPFDLSIQAFAARLLEACEEVLGEPARGDRRVPRLLASIHAADLYLATAAADGSAEATAALERWYGGLLDDLGDAAGSDRLRDELLAGGAASPLRRYLGLGSLSHWLRAGAARASAPDPPEPSPSGEAGRRPPEERRAFDVAPVRALGGLEPPTRLALTLTLVAEVAPESAAAAVAVPGGRLARSRAQIARSFARAVDLDLARAGLDARARDRAWTLTAAELEVADDREAVVWRMVGDAARHGLDLTPAPPCPDANLLLGALAGTPGLEREPILVHACRCWPCLHAIRVLAREPRPLAPRRTPRALAATAAAVGVALVALPLGWRLLRATPAPSAPVQVVDGIAPVERPESSPAAAATTTATTSGGTAAAWVFAPRATVEPKALLVPLPPPGTLAAAAPRASPAVAPARLRERETRATPAASPSPSPAARPAAPPSPGASPAARADAVPSPRLPPIRAALVRPSPSARPAAPPSPSPIPPSPRLPPIRAALARPAPARATPRIGTAAAPFPAPAATAVPSPAALEARSAEPPPPTAEPSPAPAEVVATVAPPSPAPAPLSLRYVPGDSRAARMVNAAVERYRPGEEGAALNVLRRALAMEPDLPDLHLDCALLYEQLGEGSRAGAHWRRFLELAPSGEDAARVRARLGNRR